MVYANSCQKLNIRSRKWWTWLVIDRMEWTCLSFFPSNTLERLNFNLELMLCHQKKSWKFNLLWILFQFWFLAFGRNFAQNQCCDFKYPIMLQHTGFQLLNMWLKCFCMFWWFYVLVNYGKFWKECLLWYDHLITCFHVGPSVDTCNYVPSWAFQSWLCHIDRCMKFGTFVLFVLTLAFLLCFKDDILL